jgi:site-specific DNA recombinase
MDFVKLAEFFEKNNVTFVSITQQFSSTTAMGRLTINILLSFGEFERAIITERVRDKIAASKKRGKYLGGTPTFGYDVDYKDKKLVVNTTEVKVVRRIFKRFTETGSCLGIAKELNADGIATKSWATKNGAFHQGGPWSTQHVYRALNNRTYLGETVHNGESYAGEHDSIISKSQWDRAQGIFAEGTSRKRNQETHEVKALLRGIIRCGHCGRSMVCSYTKSRKNGRVYRYYVCNGAMKYGYDSCLVKSVPAGDIEQAVIGQLRPILRSPEIIAQTFRAAVELEAHELDTLHEEQSTLETRLVELKAWASELVSSDAARETPSERFVELNTEIDLARLQLSNVQTQIVCIQGQSLSEQEVADALRKLDPVWDELFPSEQHRVFRALVESVIVNPDGLDIKLRADGIHSVVAELRDDSERKCAV